MKGLVLLLLTGCAIFSLHAMDIQGSEEITGGTFFSLMPEDKTLFEYCQQCTQSKICMFCNESVQDDKKAYLIYLNNNHSHHTKDMVILSGIFNALKNIEKRDSKKISNKKASEGEEAWPLLSLTVHVPLHYSNDIDSDPSCAGKLKALLQEYQAILLASNKSDGESHNCCNKFCNDCGLCCTEFCQKTGNCCKGFGRCTCGIIEFCSEDGVGDLLELCCTCFVCIFQICEGLN